MKKRLLQLGLFLMMVCSSGTLCYAKTEQSYVIDADGEQQVIPLAYTVSSTVTSFETRPDTLLEARDICIDSQDNLYILDSGNGRVLKQNTEGKLIQEIRPAGEYALSEPQGMYVDTDGKIYIADTGNGRILVMDANGEVLRELTQPDSPLYDKDYPFQPIKVGVNTLGQIYAINNLDYHGFCIIDSDNEFKGYFAATRLEKNAVTEFVKKFASDAQKAQMGKEIPAQHSNFVFAEDGSIYVTTTNVDSAQMKHLSTVGNNFYPYTGSFGDQTSDYLMEMQDKAGASQEFVDVCVDGDGIVTLLDHATGRIYQYDSSGVMLFAFGGTGSWSGRMMNAVAMAQDSKGNIYVLDRSFGSVQKFEATEFTKTIHQALSLHQEGRYDEAGELWEQILKIAPEYPPAHVGIGKAEVKQKNYVSAMQHYKLAGDKSGYSEAFSKYMKVTIQKNFVLIVLGIVVLIIALAQIYYFLKERSHRYRANEAVYHSGRHITVVTLFAPQEAFPLIKYERQKFEYTAPTVILCLSVVVNVVRLFVLHYPFVETNVEDTLLLQQVSGFLIPFLLWVAGYYYVSCIFDGEVKLREVYASTCYALLPYAILTLPLALLTNIMDGSGASYVNFFNSVIWIWVIILIFISIKSMNHYSAGKVILVIGVSICAVLLLAVVMTLLYLYGMKLFNFVVEVVNECKLRIT